MSSARLHIVLLLAACGPSAPMNPTAATTTADESSSAATSTSSTTAADPTTSTSTSTSGTSEVSTSLQTAEASFILPMDAICGLRSTHCTQCDPFRQDCPDGEKCSPYADDGGSSWNNIKCVPLDPDPDHAGEPCTVQDSASSGIDSCDEQSMCWDVDPDTLIGTCVPFCTGNPEMAICPQDLTCAVFNEGVLPLCLPRCDPLQQDCPPGDACILNPTDNAFLCLLDASAEQGQAFDPCMFVNSCDPGLFCDDPSSASECDPDQPGCCLPFCDLTLPLDCPGAMQTCQPFFGMMPAPPGSENVGACALP